MLFALPADKRTLKTLQRVIEQAQHAQKSDIFIFSLLFSSPLTLSHLIRIFASLAADQSPTLPYSRDIADQRRKYGDNMLRKGEEHLSKQRDYEAEAKARLDAARQMRQQERDRIAALEVSFHTLSAINELTLRLIARKNGRTPQRSRKTCRTTQDC